VLKRAAWVSFLGVTVLVAANSAVSADELLVMGYSCSMSGGRPMLSPGPEQSHRIIGQHEQRPFRACSPVNPERCRSWTVHRFDIDCEGTRVPWVAVVAAAAEQTSDRAWLEDGRLRLRMPPSWNLDPDDPCARPPGLDDRYGFGRMQRYCADRRAMAPPPVVEMPPGFAPMLGIDGIFVKSSAPAAAMAPPVPDAGASAPPAKVARAEPPPRPETVPPGVMSNDPAGKDLQTKNQPSPRPAIILPPPQATPAPAPAAKPAPSQAQSPPPAVVPGGPVIPKVINRPDAPAAETTQPPGPVAADAKPAAAPDPPPTAQASAPVPKQDGTSNPDTASGRKGSSQITVSLLSAASSPVAGGIAVLGGLAALLAVFALARRRERAQLAGTHPRDFASMSLGGKHAPAGPVAQPGTTPQRAMGVAPARHPPVQPASRLPAQPVQSGMLSALANRIPRTRAEAVQILGMGVTPQANEVAMKKIVDGLRLSWHPDLAKDEDDRRMREFRIKQINTAWDLIQGKTTERFDS
jgi:hypothetical protein